MIWRRRNLCSSAWNRCRIPEGPEGSDILWLLEQRGLCRRLRRSRAWAFLPLAVEVRHEGLGHDAVGAAPAVGASVRGAAAVPAFSLSHPRYLLPGFLGSRYLLRHPPTRRNCQHSRQWRKWGVSCQVAASSNLNSPCKGLLYFASSCLACPRARRLVAFLSSGVGPSTP